jgi:hypothetical protein
MLGVLLGVLPKKAEPTWLYEAPLPSLAGPKQSKKKGNCPSPLLYN